MIRASSVCKVGNNEMPERGIAMREGGTRISQRVGIAALKAQMRMRAAMRRALDESGQGTTEYAILVGVLVVIAIVAVTAFRGKIQELWNSISSGINGL